MPGRTPALLPASMDWTEPYFVRLRLTMAGLVPLSAADAPGGAVVNDTTRAHATANGSSQACRSRPFPGHKTFIERSAFIGFISFTSGARGASHLVTRGNGRVSRPV